MRLFLLGTTLLVCFSAVSYAAPPTGPTPYPPLCQDSSGSGGNNVIGVTAWQKWSPIGLWGSKGGQPAGLVIDFTQTSCVAQPINISVSNHQQVTIHIKGATACKGDIATESITPVQQPDVLGTLFKFFGSAPTAVGGVPLAVNPDTQDIVLPDLKNVKDTVTLACNDNNGKPQGIVKTVVVTFQNPALITASAGTLISTLGKKQYGVNTTATGVSNGIVSSQYTIGVTASSRIQLVPIAFINLYGFGSRTNHLDLQAGLGINPNGSKTRVEYQLGPTFSTHNVYIGAGFHIAQAEYLNPGYQVGQMVSQQGFTVPADWHTTVKLGFSLSYSPQVTTSGSSK